MTLLPPIVQEERTEKMAMDTFQAALTEAVEAPGCPLAV